MDSKTKKPVVGVNILLQDTGQGTITDDQGKFSIAFTGDFPVILEFSHVGYEPDTVLIVTKEGPHHISIFLESKVIPAPEVTIVGSRSRGAQDVSSSIEVSGLKQIEQRGIRDLGEVLQEMESVMVSTSEWGHQTLSIRGSNPDEVAVYLDGVKINHVASGVANLGFVDVTGLEEVEVIKGGGTVMFGSGNFGGVVLLRSRRPESTEIRIKSTSGLTTHKDQDRSFAGDLAWGPVGLGVDISGKTRLFDGRTLFFTQYQNLSGQLSTLRHDLIFRHIDLSNAIQFPSGSIITADQFYIDRVEWNYRRSPQIGWSLEGGQKQWIWEDHFFSNLQRYLKEKSQSLVVNKAFSYRLLEGNLQWEQETQSYIGNQTILDNYTDNFFRDTTHLNQIESALAATFRYQSRYPASGIALLKLEGGIRQGNVNYDEVQRILFFEEGVLKNRDTISLSHTHLLRTYRIGVAAEIKWKGQNCTFFFNAGENARLPSLSDRLLWGVGKKTLEKEYERLIHTVPVTPYHMQILQEQIQQVETELSSMEEGLLPENVSMAEVSIQWNREWMNPMPINRLELGFSVFRNFYTNKVAYHQVQDNLAVPFNTFMAQMHGWETFSQVMALDNLLRLHTSYTRLYPGNPAAFPGKPSAQAQMALDFHRRWLKANLSYTWQGPQHYLEGGVSLAALKSQSNTNATLTVTKEISFFDFSLNYTVRNLFSKKLATQIPDQNYSSDPFNYYDRHRRLISITITYHDEK